MCFGGGGGGSGAGGGSDLPYGSFQCNTTSAVCEPNNKVSQKSIRDASVVYHSKPCRNNKLGWMTDTEGKIQFWAIMAANSTVCIHWNTQHDDTMGALDTPPQCGSCSMQHREARHHIAVAPGPVVMRYCQRHCHVPAGIEHTCNQLLPLAGVTSCEVSITQLHVCCAYLKLHVTSRLQGKSQSRQNSSNYDVLDLPCLSGHMTTQKQ